VDQHRLILNTDQLDQVVKSLMQSITANTKRRRRLDATSRTGREAATEGELIAQALHAAVQAQAQSWA
jgi:hypothetical protein